MGPLLDIKSPSTGARTKYQTQTLCLLVYAALEHRIREQLKAQGLTFPHQTGKPVDNPTVRWVFQYFVGIHLLILADGQALVLNLDEHHQSLLELLGQAYEAFYS